MNNEQIPEYFCIASKIFHDRVDVTGALMPDFILETTFTNIRPEQPVTTKLFAPLKTSLSKLFVCSTIRENCIRKYNRIGESLPKGDGCSACHNTPIILSPAMQCNCGTFIHTTKATLQLNTAVQCNQDGAHFKCQIKYILSCDAPGVRNYIFARISMENIFQ